MGIAELAVLLNKPQGFGLFWRSSQSPFGQPFSAGCQCPAGFTIAAMGLTCAQRFGKSGLVNLAWRVLIIVDGPIAKFEQNRRE